MPTRLPASERRRQLLDRAAAVFAHEGYHASSMNAIADAAGVTKPVLYQHFPSKRALFLEVLDEVGEQLRAIITEATDGAGSPREQVYLSIHSFFSFVHENESSFRLLFGGSTRNDPEFGAKVSAVEQTIADALAERIAIDSVDAEHRRLLAHGLVGLTEATMRRWIADGRTVPVDELAAQVADLTWGGLRGLGSSVTSVDLPDEYRPAS